MPSFFMIDLQGTEISAEEKVILQHENVGALLLFTRNFANRNQLQTLSEAVRDIRPDIFIAVDQEGGNVQRLQRYGFRSLPAARVYGDVYDLNKEAGVKLAEQYGEIMALDLLGSGIDLSLAPILDLHDVSEVIAKFDRAFHANPDVVVALAAAFIRGMNKAGMPATGKHFPGHGCVLSDSHTSSPVSTASASALRNKDLKPFAELIARDALSAIMPAHVTYTSIDADHAAGFSKIWLQDVLRHELNFKGLVISDCLGMVGADIGNMLTRVYQALVAGCDMVIVCNQTRKLLLEVVQVTFEQSPESCQRIAAFKSKMVRFSSVKQDKIISAPSKLSEHTNQSPTKPDDEQLNNTRSI